MRQPDARHDVLQQRGLADPRLAAQDQHPAVTRLHASQQPIERLALAASTEEPRGRSRLAMANGEPGGGTAASQGPRISLGTRRGTEESNLALRFWRPPCYRYTSPPGYAAHCTSVGHASPVAPERATSRFPT